MRIAGGARGGVRADVAECVFERLREAEGDGFPCLRAIGESDGADVEPRRVVEANRLRGHAAPALRISSRSDWKKPSSARTPGPAAAPSSSERPQVLAVALAPDQLAQVLAGAAVAARGDLPVDEGLESFGQGDVHSGHSETVPAMANFGKLTWRAKRREVGGSPTLLAVPAGRAATRPGRRSAAQPVARSPANPRATWSKISRRSRRARGDQISRRATGRTLRPPPHAGCPRPASSSASPARTCSRT